VSAPVAFHRPPREYPAPVPSQPLRVPQPPTVPTPTHQPLLQVMFPVVGAVGMVGYALLFGSSGFLLIAGAIVVLMLVFSFGLRWSQRRAARRSAGREARRYAKHLRDIDSELATAGDLQRRALGRLYPESGEAWTLAVKRRGTWERRPDDGDFLRVRLGTGTVALDRPVDFDVNPLTEYQPQALQEARRMLERRTQLRNQPVITDLRDVGVLAVAGDRAQGRAWARALLDQLGAFRSPHDLRLLVACDHAQAGDWEWAKWLPHARIDRHASGAAVPALALTESPAELAALLGDELPARIEQLRRLAEVGGSSQAPPLLAPELLVVIDGYTPTHPVNELPLLRELLVRARSLRVVVVLIVDDPAQAPSRIDARLTIPARGPARYELMGPDAPAVVDLRADQADVSTSEALARTLAPLRLEEGGQGQRSLGVTVRLVDLLGVGSAALVEPQRVGAPLPRPSSLRVPIGVAADGEQVVLDLKQTAEGGMGPHGMLVGATGSGKSELLRSIVVGLAATHDPERLSFVLIDYKGGAAFADLERLPHVAGLITNLQRDLSLVDRMRDALIGEQERRQTMLREAGNVDDAIAYRERRARDAGLAPMPDLLVIVDEFSELLSARPEFVDLFAQLGRVGRSLGIHLLVSSQRLDEGRLRGLESNLRYRICLRTYSDVDSKTVLGTRDAFLLPSLPGLGYLKVDTGIYQQFRGALASTPHRDVEQALEPAVDVRRFGRERPSEPDSVMGTVADAADAGDGAGPERARSDLQVMVARIVDVQAGLPSVHQVWVAPLPRTESLDHVLSEPAWWSYERCGERPGSRLEVVLGRLDRPLEQRTEPLRLDFAGRGGHLAVVGAPRTGKSTLLRTLIASLVWSHTPLEARFYCLDLGGGGLDALAAAPHVGGVAGRLEGEAVLRAVRQMRTELEEREEVFRRHGLDSIAHARRLRRVRPDDANELELPDLFLVIDGWDTLKRDFEDLDQEVEELAAGGLTFGLHVVVSANRWADMRQALLDNLGSRLELRVNDPLDSMLHRAVAASVPEDAPGRGLTSEELHFQTALPRLDGRNDEEDLSRGLRALAAEAAEHWDGPTAEPIRLLPRELSAAELPSPSRTGIPIGVEERALAPVTVDLGGGDPHLLVFGDSGMGKSSLLRLLARGLASAHAPDELRLILFDVRRSLGDVATYPHVSAYAPGGPAMAEAAERLRAELASRLPSASEPSAALVSAPAWSGPRFVLVVDDYDLITGPASPSPLTPLIDLLPVGRDIGLHVVLSRRVGGTARGAYEAVFARVRELGTPALLLGGDPGEGPLIGGHKAAPQPPGRGLLVRRGQRPLTVQTAYAGLLGAEPGRTGDAPAPMTIMDGGA